MFQRGAFTRTLQDQGGRFRQTAECLEVVGLLDRIPQADRALEQLRSGTITDLSIGWEPLAVVVVKPEALSKYGARPDAIAKYMAQGESVRVVTEARLWEVSLVTFGA